MASETPSGYYETINFVNRRNTSSSQSLRVLSEQSVSKRLSVSTYLCVVVLLLSVVCNTFLIGFIIYKQLQNESSASQDELKPSLGDMSRALCVSCDSFNLPDPTSAPLMARFKVTKLDQRSLCCQENSEGLTSLIDLLVRQYYGYKHGVYTADVDTLTPNTPSAHLYIDTDNIRDERLSWDTEPGFGTAHKSGGISYNNGSIHIPRDGVYNVYTFLTLHNAVTDVNFNIVHSVNRINPLLSYRTKLLLLNKLSLQSRRGQFTTSFLAANLKLKKYDELHVQFSNPSLIYNFPPANYFGVYML